MLGLEKTKSSWNWVAHGKHPCAKDYVTIGQDDALSEAFAAWVEKGYTALDKSIKKAAITRSWRFWSRTPRGEILIIGIIRDSCDAIGRPYPLLLMGVGVMPEWHSKWHLLPYACDGTWTQMEQLSARRYDDTSSFRIELATSLRPPRPDWDLYEHEVIQMLERLDNHGHVSDIKSRAASYGKVRDFVVDIEAAEFDSVISALVLWHFLLKSYNATTPNSVFMGGTGVRSRLALFNRPLSGQDFATLWSVETNGEQGKWS